MSSTEPNSQENIHNFVSNDGYLQALTNMRTLLSEGKITNIDVLDKTPDDNKKIHNHTALMVQAGWGTLTAMKMLLGKDKKKTLSKLNIPPANPNLQDENGYTALHLAIIGGKDSYEKVKLLLESRADKGIKSSIKGGGETPLELVKRTYSTQDKERKKIIELLTEPLFTEQLFTEKSSKSSKSLSNGGTNRNKSKKTHNKFFGRTRKQNVIKKSTSKNPFQREK
jgi:ankyrin repeat protein